MLGEWLGFLANYGTAWLAVILAVILSIKYVVRKFGSVKRPNIAKINKLLGRSHILMGIILIAVGLVHGLASSQSVFSLNIGTISWILSILLGVNFIVRKHLPQKSTWIVIHRILTLIFIASIVWHVIDVGGVAIFKEAGRINNGDLPQASQAASSESSTDSSAGNYAGSSSLVEEMNQAASGAVFTDGTYTGVADAFGPDLTVSVTIKDSIITDIEIVSHNERNQRYFGPPMRDVPAEIIEKQSLDVDIVAGATYTSVGIINAVYDALSKALVSGEIH